MTIMMMMRMMVMMVVVVVVVMMMMMMMMRMMLLLFEQLDHEFSTLRGRKQPRGSAVGASGHSGPPPPLLAVQKLRPSCRRRLYPAAVGLCCAGTCQLCLFVEQLRVPEVEVLLIVHVQRPSAPSLPLPLSCGPLLDVRLNADP